MVYGLALRMSQDLRFNYRTWQLDSREWKLRRAYRPHFRKAQGWREEQDIWGEFDSQLDNIRYDRMVLRDERLQRDAARFFVLIPKYRTDGWEEVWGGAWFLTDQSVRAIVADINKAKKELQELRNGWIRYLTAVTGLIGALIGLAAMLVRK